MDDLFGDDFNSSVPTTTTTTTATANPMESTPAVSLEGQLGDVVDGLGVMNQTGPVDPAESFITKEKVDCSVNYDKTNSMYYQEQLGDLGLDLGIGEPAPLEGQQKTQI